MKKATYSVFVRFRRKRLILKRSVSYDEAVQFVEQARRERIHAKDDVILVEDATGMVVTGPPDSGVSPSARACAGAVRAMRDALGLARLIAVAHADRTTQGFRAARRVAQPIAPVVDAIVLELEDVSSRLLNVSFGSPEYADALARAHAALARLAELKLATDADELVRVALDSLRPAPAKAVGDDIPEQA